MGDPFHKGGKAVSAPKVGLPPGATPAPPPPAPPDLADIAAQAAQRQRRLSMLGMQSTFLTGPRGISTPPSTLPAPSLYGGR